MKLTILNLSFSLLILTCLTIPVLNAKPADTLSVSSPSGRIVIKTWMAGRLTYDVLYDGRKIMNASAIDLQLDKSRSVSSAGAIRSHSVNKITARIICPVPEKRRIIPDVYNLLTIRFRQPFRVEFRVYDDGLAYRILSAFSDSVFVENEVAEFRFPPAVHAWFPQIHKRSDADIFHTSFEEEYQFRRIDSIKTGEMAFSPVLMDPATGPKIAITESDLEEYPGMFLGGTGSAALRGVFAGYPLEEKATEGIYPQMLVTKRAPYIARTIGTRSFPWRVIIIAVDDHELPLNDLVYRLGASSRIGDLSWIEPGNLTDEWIIDLNLFNVPFRAGLNSESYKYYLDFAKRFGFRRIMMDAGWSDNRDLFKITQAINMDTLLAYAGERGVKLSMWTLAMTLDRQLDSALDRFCRWGVNFIMTDFIDRDDQKAVRFYYRIAKACADHKIMIMFHGAFPPKGFNRTYPNAVAREGVLGSEYNIWSSRVTPQHDLTLPFTRMLAGGFDYEPGLLNNATKTGTRPVSGVVTSPGTRCHQLAMFVVYDSPMQIFSGNPSEGMREPEMMSLIGHLPTTWDETLIPAAKVPEYIVTVRRNGESWFAAGMCDWDPRDIVLKLDFLSEGELYSATLCTDGINADRYAADYVLQKDITFKKGDEIKIHLATGGGFLARFDRK